MRAADLAGQWRPTEARAEDLEREAADADARARYHASEAIRLSAYAERMRGSAVAGRISRDRDRLRQRAIAGVLP